MEKGLQLAIRAMGSRYKIAKALGLTPPAVQKWTHVPAGRVVAVEKITGVDRAKLRPDLYEREPA